MLEKNRTKRCDKGVTLLELPGCVLWIILIYVVYQTTLVVFGEVWWARALGLAVGATLPVLIAETIMAVTRVKPERPICKRGICKANDYELSIIRGEIYDQCKCGDLYKKEGRRFFSILDDGENLPYKKWKPFYGREDDI